jgi:glycosyltransferase involved in cell wall biosynthesis
MRDISNKSTPNVVICIPCYNEEKRLNVRAFEEFTVTHEHIKFLFINDGSRDNTLKLLEKITINSNNLFLLNLEKNGGKAEAVRRGMLYAKEAFRADYVGFWDADLATPLEEILQFIKLIQEGNFDAVTGLRLMRLGARVKRKNLRHILGRIFATVASNVLKVPVYDTQCGAKLFKEEIIPYLFTETFSTRWLFDVEILARNIQKNGTEHVITKVYEYPVFTWQDIGGSQVKLKDFVKAPWELFKIKRRYLRKANKN